MAIIAMFPAGSYAAEDAEGFDVAETSGQKITVVQEYTYNAGQTPEIPNSISQFGRTLSLVSVSEPVETISLPVSRTYTYSVPVIYKPEDLSRVPDNVELTPVYSNGMRQVDRRETIRDLPDNDVDKLPQQKSYNDTNGQGPGASAGVLVLAEVKYEVTSRDRDGLPDRYTAHLVYRGEESYQELLHYTAVAAYTTTVTETGLATYTVVAVYEGEVPVENEEDDPAFDENDIIDPVVPGENANGSGSAGSGNAGPGNAGSGGGTGQPASKLQFPANSISPLGTAALVTIVAAVLMLLILTVYNRRRLREV